MLGIGGVVGKPQRRLRCFLTASVRERDSGMINAEAMNSVPEKKHGRATSILTKDVMAGIPVLVQQG